MGLDPRWSVGAANSTWQWTADLSAAVAANTTLTAGGRYLLQNLASAGVYLGWGADSAGANTQSGTGKGRYLDAGAECYVEVFDSRYLVLSATPASGTSSVRILKLQVGDS